MDVFDLSRGTARSERVPAMVSREPQERDVPTPRVLQLPKPVLACRPMADRDIEAAVGLLTTGFPERDPNYWRRALCRLRDRAVPNGRPRYGYVMTDRDRLVGILLIIFAKTDTGATRGNVSSWYVDSAYRGFSNLLLSAPLRLKDVTLLNISPAPTTLDTIEAQGFSKYVEGTFQAIAALAPPVPGVRIRRIKPDAIDTLALLTDHAGWGCFSFEVSYDGKTYPFVFAPSRFVGDALPCAHLVYCQAIDDFVRFAGPLGRRLLRHGLPAVLIDANGPLEGLRGTHRPGRGRRFYCGGERPRLGDLSYTELAIFGG